MSIFSRISRSFVGMFKDDGGRWPRPARGLPPERLWPNGVNFANPIPGATEVTNASTHRGWRDWTRQKHLAERLPKRMINNTDYLRDGVHRPDTDARTGKIDWRD
jgi:hypothetical protein